MSAPHTPGPWFVGTQNDGLYVLDGQPSPAPYDGPIPKEHGPDVVATPNWRLAGHEANAHRIVACVNACEGLPDPSVVPELLAALKLFMTCYPAAIAALNDEQQQLIRGALAKAGR